MTPGHDDDDNEDDDNDHNDHDDDLLSENWEAKLVGVQLQF